MIRVASPEDVDDLIDVNIRTWVSTYQGIVDEELLASMTPASLREKWERTLTNTHSTERFCFVAATDDRVIGYIVCGPNRDQQYHFEWELFAIYVLKEYQGQGIGRSLLMRSIAEMKQKGVRSFILFVLEENVRTRKFYESFSPTFQCSKEVTLGDKHYPEIGYGWSDINSF